MGLFHIVPSLASMGISRDSRHKRRSTGGKRKAYRKKRKFEMGRPAAMTRICTPGQKRVRRVRTRGGHSKFRALRLDAGNYSWASESVAKKTRVLKVVYNASSNELVRTNTLVKNAIVLVDATPFRQWYEQHYGQQIGTKKSKARRSPRMPRVTRPPPPSRRRTCSASSTRAPRTTRLTRS